MNSLEIFNVLYKIFEEYGIQDEKFGKEIQLALESLKITLDEKSISEIIPGSNLFVLHQVQPKEVTYIDYEYDEDYNYKEVKKKKEELVPDFSYIFSTHNTKYWERFRDTFLNKKYFKDNLVESNGIKYLHFDDEFIQDIYFDIHKDHVIITSDINKLKPKNNSLEKATRNHISKNSVGINLELNRIIYSFKDNFQTKPQLEIYDYLVNNTQKVQVSSYIKNNNLITDFTFSTTKNHENGLMYIFDFIEKVFINENPPSKF